MGLKSLLLTDFFALDINLRFKNKKRHTTVMGVIISYLMIAISIMAVYFFGIEIIDK